MTPRSLSPRDRRAVLLGAALLLPALLWTLVASPWLDALHSRRARLDEARRLLGRELELLAQARGFPRVFDQGARRLLAEAPRLMGGDDDAAAGAAVAGYVRRLARMGGANVTRVEPAPVHDAGGDVTALPVAVTGEADLEGLMSFLQLLETGPKLVRVDQLKIEAQDGPATAGAAYSPTPFFVAPGGGSEVIRFTFTATGYTLATGRPVPADSAEAAG
ncbi:MAG TPA: type II secretion system protein GspM [Longimicrobium sp.]|nr:type II secretion system protein GspM [Longimicrobium sp.]